MELHIESTDADARDKAFNDAWDRFARGDARDPLHGQPTDEEAMLLRVATDAPCVCWMWAASRIGELAEEGYIPPLQSPTYGRILQEALNGFDAIRTVRSSIEVQAPFIYVQMLASLVHINNIVNAISFGLTWGATVGTLLIYYGIRIPVAKEATKTTDKEATADMQALLVSFIFSCFGPFIYQALLETSIAIAQPFSNEDAVVPTERMVDHLELCLHESAMLSTKINWKAPCFKKS